MCKFVFTQCIYERRFALWCVLLKDSDITEHLCFLKIIHHKLNSRHTERYRHYSKKNKFKLSKYIFIFEYSYLTSLYSMNVL